VPSGCDVVPDYACASYTDARRSLSSLPDFLLVGLDFQSGIRRQIDVDFWDQSPGMCFRFEAGGNGGKEYAQHGHGVAVLPHSLFARDARKKLVICRLPPGIRIQDLLIDRDADIALTYKAIKLDLKEVTKRLLGDE